MISHRSLIMLRKNYDQFSFLAPLTYVVKKRAARIRRTDPITIVELVVSPVATVLLEGADVGVGVAVGSAGSSAAASIVMSLDAPATRAVADVSDVAVVVVAVAVVVVVVLSLAVVVATV